MHHFRVGVLQVGKLDSLFIVPYQRKSVGPKYKGEMLFMRMHQHNVRPENVDNFYACAAASTTSVKYVRVQDLCTILAKVKTRVPNPAMVNLVPIAHAFPVSWIAS
jgi:hypothetical protein